MECPFFGDLGEAWSSDEEEEAEPREGGEPHVVDPLREVQPLHLSKGPPLPSIQVDTQALLAQSVSSVMGNAEIKGALIPLLPTADKAALAKAGFL